GQKAVVLGVQSNGLKVGQSSIPRLSIPEYISAMGKSSIPPSSAN
ncbi:hypothetical protein Tco_0580055, partial [Tanacetum coccineum]